MCAVAVHGVVVDAVTLEEGEFCFFVSAGAMNSDVDCPVDAVHRVRVCGGDALLGLFGVCAL